MKTTLATTSHTVTVHGEDQLLPPDGAPLYLHLVRLEPVPDGDTSVASLVDAILCAGVEVADLYALIADTGIPPQHVAAATMGFDIRERLTVAVDEQLPRIVPGSFVGGARPVGVDSLTYRLDLAPHLLRKLSSAQWSTLVHTIVYRPSL